MPFNQPYQVSVLLGGHRKYIIQKLHGNGIVTVLDYVNAKKQRLYDTLITQKLLPTDVDQIFNELDIEVAKITNHKQVIIPTQIEYLKLVDVGYLNRLIPMQHITTITGEQCSGKSTFVWRLLQMNPTLNTLYLDCSYNMNKSRVMQILRHNNPEHKVQEILNNITIQQITTIKELKDAIADSHHQLLILDGMLTVFSEFEDEVYHLHHQLNEFMVGLYMMCQSNSVTILIINRTIQDNLTQIQNTKFDQFINPYVQCIINQLLIKQLRVMKIHRALEELPFDQSIGYSIKDSGFIFDFENV